MDKTKISQTIDSFNSIIHSEHNGQIEYWYARDLMVLLGYSRWENFANAIQRAMDSCETSGANVADQFREVTKMVSLGSGAQRPIADYMLTRHRYSRCR